MTQTIRQWHNKMRPPLKDFSTIYKITCIPNGLSYIGQTRDFDRRQKEYKREYLIKDNYLFYKDMRLLGLNDFKFEILETCDIDVASKREKFWIKELNTHAPNGYNISIGGNTWAWKNPEETKKKISEKAMGRKPSIETRKLWRKHRSGEKNSKAKLTSEDIKNIRTTYVFRKTKMKDIAKKYNVVISTIQRIINDTGWKSEEKTIKQYDSVHSNDFPKGTKIKHLKYGICYVGGYLRNRLSLYNIETRQRLTQNAKVEDCIKL